MVTLNTRHELLIRISYADLAVVQDLNETSEMLAVKECAWNGRYGGGWNWNRANGECPGQAVTKYNGEFDLCFWLVVSALHFEKCCAMTGICGTDEPLEVDRIQAGGSTGSLGSQ